MNKSKIVTKNNLGQLVNKISYLFSKYKQDPN